MWPPGSASWTGNGARRALGVARSSIERASASACAFEVKVVDRDGDEVGVGDLRRAGEEGASHRLGHAVQGPGRPRAVGLEVEALEDVEHLADDDPPRRGGAHPVDLVASEARVDRRPLLRAIGGQVVERDQAPPLRHVPRDDPGRLSRVELVGAVLGDPVERVGQVALDQEVARVPGAPVGLAERGDRLGEVGEPVRAGAEVVATRDLVPGPASILELRVERGRERLRDPEPIAGPAGPRGGPGRPTPPCRAARAPGPGPGPSRGPRPRGHRRGDGAGASRPAPDTSARRRGGGRLRGSRS